MNPIERINLNIKNFTKSESEIADHIIKNPFFVVQMPIVELAKKISTSKSALIRFSQKIGYNGFSEFKFDLSRYLVSSNQDEPNNKILSIVSDYAEYINRIGTMISIKDLSYIANSILKSKKIKIFGINRTSFSALQLKYRLAKIGFDSEALSDIYLMNDCASMLNEHDLCIIFSITGSKNIYLDKINILKENKCKIILISMEPNNPLKNYCDATILLPYISKLSNIKLLDNQAIFFVFIEILLSELADLSKK